MKKFLFVVSLLVSCGPNWAECPDCEPAVAPEVRAVPAIVITVNVDNDVTVDVDQSTSVQVEEQDDAPANCCVAPTPVTPLPAPKLPENCECKKVCKQHKRVHIGHGRWSCNKKDKFVCIKTVYECKRK